MNPERKIILYIAMSLDGYISKPGDDLGFLTLVEMEGEDYGYARFIETVDTVILGRKTYDIVMSMGIGFPHADKNVFVITRTPRPDIGKIKFYAGNLRALILKLKSGTGKNIFCDGGAETVNVLMRDDLIDEFIISIIPVFLGNGIRLFKDGRPELNLELVNSKHFSKGLVQLHYKRSGS